LIQTRLFRGYVVGVVLAVMFPARFLFASIDTNLQMQLGNPSGAIADTNNHNHYLIQRTVEAIDYSDNFGLPNWASWDLTANDLGSSGRTSSFYTDTNLPPNFYRVNTDDYSGSGYDRGHMCPSADRTTNSAVNKLVFFMSNIIPQAPNNNEGVWGTFEGYCRTLAESGNELLIICGPSGFNGTLIQPGQSIFVPQYTWKIVVVVPPGSDTNVLNRIDATTRVISLKIPNSNGVSSSWQNYVTSARQIEVDTGYTFFTALPADIAAALRDKVDGRSVSPPVINGFSPASGAVSSSVVVTGANFSSASAVTFNGVSAPFTVNSATQITATVPTNSTSGKISVTVPTGTGLSTNSYSVTGSTVDLTITKSHFGSFSQGDFGDTYTITVANIGTMASSGTVTVTDALPSGLTAAAISGVGWNVNLSTRTCTRSNALFAGASYPPITVTVNVSDSAPASVTNIATVSGGGDANSANNTVSDITVINASSGSTGIPLAGWDVSTLTGGTGNYGPSPFAATATNAHITTVGLTRGSGVGTSGSAAGHAWGGVGFTAADAPSAVTANQFVTFTITNLPGYRVSYTSISKFDYRRSSTGPASGVLQYQIGSGTYSNITSLSYPSTSSSGGSLNPINLSGFSDLQNVGPGTGVTFRIVNYGGGSSGTWYVFDVANSTAPDLVIEGTVASTNAPNLVIAKTHLGNFTQGDSGDTYTITVTNIGSAATVGTVTVVDTLPAGLTATAIGGAGWTANLNTLTCTRSESLAAGTSYPPITVVVDVATNAVDLTNTASVSGGFLNTPNITPNNTASDPTTVIALRPVELWRLQWFGITADTGAAADTAVSSSDNMPNLLKYALDLDPLVPATNPVVGDISTGYLRLTVPRNPDATDITYRLEMTGDLTLPFTTNGITIDQNTPTLLQGHDNTPVSTPTNGFMRLHVTRP
jgi:uncharacterized repeat protein (TIGR01451 family)